MQRITIHPILGLMDNVPLDSPMLFKGVGENVYLTHDTGGQNMDYIRKRSCASKAFGRTAWSNSANAVATFCNGLHEIYNGTNRDNIMADGGTVFVFDGNKDPVSKGAGFHASNLFSFIQFGGYTIFSDGGNLTPYKWGNGDANVSKLILAGTEYKFKYLQHLGNRIIGAHSNQTNGDLDVRWTGVLPTWATLEFAAANQLYKPEGDSITGIGKLCHDNLFLFSRTDIARIDHNENATIPFSIVRVAVNYGSSNHQSIVSDGLNLYFYDPQHGFCKYNGGREVQVISGNIETTISQIGTAYEHLIVGTLIPPRQEIAWTVPLSNATCNNILYYNLNTGEWTQDTHDAYYIDFWEKNKLLVWAKTDGKVYERSGETDNTGAWNGYRIEPILPLGPGERFKRLLEIKVQSTNAVNKELHFWHRGGDTVSEVAAASWTSLGSINLNNPTTPVLYTDVTAKLHQIKWGTDAASELFQVPSLQFGFVMQGNY